MRVDSIRFSQATITGPTRLQGIEVTLPELTDAFRSQGYISDPIAVVRLPDGKFTSIDNRRLYAAHLAGLSHIPVVLHDPDEPWGNASQHRSLVRKTALIDEAGELGAPGRVLVDADQTPDTHLLAAVRRCGNQRERPGHEQFPLGGSFELPRHTHDRRLPNRTKAEDLKLRRWTRQNGAAVPRPESGTARSRNRGHPGSRRRGRGGLER